MPQPRRERETHEHPLGSDLIVTPLPLAASPMTRDDLRGLIERPDAITASIYVPCHRAGPERQQDRIRVKNLVREAQRMVQTTGGPPELPLVLETALQATGEPDFWRQQTDGLVLFATVAGWRHFWVPVPLAVPALAVVADRPHLKPIVDVAGEDDRYYLLELAQHGVHLHAGSLDDLRPVPLAGVPPTVEEATPAHEAEPYLGVRTTHAAGQGPAQFFGSIGETQHKERIAHYFRLVDAQVCRRLQAEQVPVVLAGVDYLIPLYREVSQYPHLLSDSIAGNQELSPTASLHERSWRIVAAHHRRLVTELGKRFTSLESHGRASRDLSVILPAVFQGRISDLFVAREVDHWGTYVPAIDRLHRHALRRPEDEDLVNLALVQALRTRARVHVGPRDQVPGGGDMAAYFRF